MADFCAECSVEMFGEDFGELKGLSTEEQTNEGLYCRVICEGCGLIQVNYLGKCVSSYCNKHGEQPDGIQPC